MSVINQMLQDLDRRNAIPGLPGPMSAMPVRPSAKESTREWFWRVLAALMLGAVAWTGWVAYQLRPADLATPSAFAAAEIARAKAAQSQVGGKVNAPAPRAPSPPEPAQAEVVLVQPPVLETHPVPAVPAASASAPAAPASAPKAAAQRAKAPASGARTARLESLNLPPAKVLPDPPSRPARVQRRDRVSAPGEVAEREFRRGVALLKQGRQPEAEGAFKAALGHETGHRGARQALVALMLERGNLEGARHLLEAGLALDPAQPEFATTLARIHIERKDFDAALAALEGSAAGAATHSEYHFMRGTVLQRLGRDQEAAAAYRACLQVQSGNPHAWIGLGISLEAMRQRPEAADAFRRALAVGPGNAELKAFAEQRLRALR